MSEWILTLVTFLPLIGALFLLLINGVKKSEAIGNIGNEKRRKP